MMGMKFTHPRLERSKEETLQSLKERLGLEKSEKSNKRGDEENA